MDQRFLSGDRSGKTATDLKRTYRRGGRRQFVGAQLLRFVDFSYKPVTDMVVYEGKTAEDRKSVV